MVNGVANRICCSTSKISTPVEPRNFNLVMWSLNSLIVMPSYRSSLEAKSSGEMANTVSSSSPRSPSFSTREVWDNLEKCYPQVFFSNISISRFV